MPDSAPEEYKKLAERYRDSDPDKHPDAQGTRVILTAMHNNVKPLSRLEKELIISYLRRIT